MTVVQPRRKSCSSRRAAGVGLALGLVLLAAAGWTALSAQEQASPRTLLPPALLAAMADEVSGSQAMADAIDLVGYEHDRPAEEYGTGTYREAAVAAAKARAYGFSSVSIERFPETQPQWDGEMAELWIEQPMRRLVARYRDQPAMLVPGSRSAEVTTEMVYVGRGDRDTDYAGHTVAGKIVLVSGPVAAAHNLAVRRLGAAGVVSFFNGTGKPLERPDQVAWSNLGPAPPLGPDGQPQKTTFGLMLSLRAGLDLVHLLEANPKVVARATVKAAERPADIQMVVATIAGDDTLREPEKTELAFVAHLFEGIAKQGANDNAASVAVQLDLGRTWISLIRTGVLPRPKRTVRFLWVPEIVGSRAYLTRHPEIAARTLAAINMDAVSADQSKNRNSLHLNTTPDSLPSFLNDVCTQFFEFVGDTNRDKLHNRRTVMGFTEPILDPRGTRDPFWYHIEKFYGSSDHQVFLDHAARIPSVQFGNWPEIVYHTSDDTPALLDPTQMKRAAFLGLAVGHVLAGATASDAVRIAALSGAYARRRLGDELLRSTTVLDAAPTAADLHASYKNTLQSLHWAYVRERAQVRSAVAMATDRGARDQIARTESALAAGEAVDRQQLAAVYATQCASLGTAPVLEPALTAGEVAASRRVPKRPAAPRSAGPGGASTALTGYYAAEARAFADGSHSILDIRNAISAEFGPIEVERVDAFFRDLERTEHWTIDAATSQPGR